MTWSTTLGGATCTALTVWITVYRHQHFIRSKRANSDPARKSKKKSEKCKAANKASDEIFHVESRFGTSGKEKTDTILYSRRREKKHSAISARNVPVIITEHVDEYRDAIQLCVEPTDTVLEVGCQVGVTTNKISAHVSGAGYVAGADKSSFSIAQASARFPHIDFHEVDAHNLEAVQRVTEHRQFDKIFLDISGSVDVGVMAKLIERYQLAMQPTAIIVKSFKMVRLLNQCITPAEYVRKLQEETQLNSATDKPMHSPLLDKEHRVLRAFCQSSSKMGSPFELLAKRPVQLSRAFTMWSAVCRTVLCNDTSVATTLRIHVLGLDPTEQQDPKSLQYHFINIFAQLARMGGVEELTVVIIGPSVGIELNQNNSTQNKIEYQVRKDQSVIRVVQYCEQCLYHESDSAYAGADLCVLFHPGIWGYPSWERSIQVLAAKRCPVVVTSYNKYEALDDRETVTEMLAASRDIAVKWCWEPEENEWGSSDTRPSGIPDRECRENSYWQCWVGK